MTHDTDAELLPCPFCGAGVTSIRENGKVWTGQRYSEPTSVSVQHHCEPIDGQPSRMIERVGRNLASAVSAWNSRATAAPVPQEIKMLLDAISRCADFIEDAQVSSGVCCCGDSMEWHADPMVSGHAAVDQWDWSASCMVQELRAIIAAAPQPPEAAPLELPAPEFYADDRGYEVSAEWLESEDATSDYRAVYTMPRYTEQQVRDLLANHGIKVNQ